MRSHLHTQVNRKVSRFIVGEEGKVGSRSAFTAAAFIGATSLAGILLAAPNADAAGWCGDQGAWCPDHTPYCCRMGMGNNYVCLQQDPNIAGIECWQV